MTAGDATPESREQIQRALLIDSFGGTVAVGKSRGTPSGEDFLYAKGTILVREQYFDRVRAILEQLFLFPADDDADRRPEPVLAGIRRIRLRPDVNPQLGMLDVLDLIHDGGEVEINLPEEDVGQEKTGEETRPPTAYVRITGVGRGRVASVDTVVHATKPGNGAGCPAAEPEPLPAGTAPYPGFTLDRCAGEGVKVVVVDTGFDATAPQRSWWLKGVTGEPDIAMAGTTLNGYAGHGTFIAGIIRCIAPLAEVHVRQVLGFGGGVLESELVKVLDDVLETDHPDIISMSAGTYTYDASGLLTFPVFHEQRLSHHKGVVMVVAAGNDGDRKPFWPAAAPYTVSVGALNAHWRGRAEFSNHGGWVDVYAPGEDLINAFPTGTYTYREPPHVGRVEEFEGTAMWSGTSFSTPVVAGLIAARMSRTGENGQDAAAALVAEAQGAAQPGVGAVLFPE